VDASQYWNSVAPGLCKFLGLSPISIEEAEEIFQGSVEESLTDEQIQSIIEWVKKKIISQQEG